MFYLTLTPWVFLQLVLFALGLSYVVTRSEIGFPLRFLWCYVLRGLYRKVGRVVSPWSLVLCPSCNSWWMGLILALVVGGSWFEALQVAFSTCGLMAILQAMAGGDIAPADDMEAILGLQKEEE